MKKRLAIPPNDRGPAAGISFISEKRTELYSLVPATGDEQPRFIRIERADVMRVTDQRMSRFGSVIVRRWPETNGR